MPAPIETIKILINVTSRICSANQYKLALVSLGIINNLAWRASKMIISKDSSFKEIAVAILSEKENRIFVEI